MQYVTLGNTGLTVSRLAIGTGTSGFGGRSEQSALGIDGLAHLLQEGYEHGITFWDAADGYGTHPHVARALQSVPRERVVIATKTMSRSKKDAGKDVDRFRREIGTDVLDIVLMHFVTTPDWERSYAGAMEALSRAKEQGSVRAVGISSHNLGALQRAVTSDWVDVVLARINYAGTNMDAKPERVVPVLRELYDAGKAVYGMKVLGRGSLAGHARQAIDFVLGLGTVEAITIGTTTQAQLTENIQLVEELAPQYPLRARTAR